MYRLVNRLGTIISISCSRPHPPSLVSPSFPLFLYPFHTLRVQTFSCPLLRLFKGAPDASLRSFPSFFLFSSSQLDFTFFYHPTGLAAYILFPLETTLRTIRIYWNIILSFRISLFQVNLPFVRFSSIVCSPSFQLLPLSQRYGQTSVVKQTPVRVKFSTTRETTTVIVERKHRKGTAGEPQRPPV